MSAAETPAVPVWLVTCLDWECLLPSHPIGSEAEALYLAGVHDRLAHRGMSTARVRAQKARPRRQLRAIWAQITSDSGLSAGGDRR